MTKSKLIIQSSLAILMLLVAASLCPAAEDMGIITGGDKGTYYQFGLDLQKLTKPAVNLTVHTSKGSIENIFAVYQRPGVQMGIVQSDVLAFVARVQSDPVLSRIAKKTRMVFPLYNEEVHLLGKKGIRDFDDLAGKRVAIGRDGSGTYLTSRLLFKLSEVAPAEMVPIDTGEALAELKAGRIDAMFYVAGFPVKLLKDDVTDKDGLELIPITNKSITEFYPRADIPANVYEWQKTAGQQRGGQGGARVVRLPPERLRQHRPLRPDHPETDALAAPEWAPEVEGGRSQLSAEGLGAVRLRAEVHRLRRGRARGGEQARGKRESGLQRDQGASRRVGAW